MIAFSHKRKLWSSHLPFSLFFYANFGWSLAIEGSNILVGAFAKDSGSILNVGGAYHFDTAGTEIQKFMAPTPTNEDRFGAAVAISGSTFVIGAYLHDNKRTNSGTAYIFSSDGTFIQQIYPDSNTVGAFLDGFSRHPVRILL